MTRTATKATPAGSSCNGPTSIAAPRCLHERVHATGFHTPARDRSLGPGERGGGSVAVSGSAENHRQLQPWELTSRLPPWLAGSSVTLGDRPLHHRRDVGSR